MTGWFSIKGTQPIFAKTYKHWICRWLSIRYIRILYENFFKELWRRNRKKTLEEEEDCALFPKDLNY